MWDPNPTLDIAFDACGLEQLGVLYALREVASIGGKGTLVVRALRQLGVDVAGIAPVAGPIGDAISSTASALELPITYERVSGQSRTAVTVVDGSSELNVNGPGPSTSDSRWTAHVDGVVSRAVALSPRWLVLAGRPPQGQGGDPGGVERVLKAARSAGIQLAVDAASPTLPVALACGLDLVKINRREAAAALDAAADASAEWLAVGLIEAGARLAVVTDGPEKCAVASADARLCIRPPAISLRSSIGCGDCFLAGFLEADLLGGKSLPEMVAAAIGVASAAAETLLPGEFDTLRARSLTRAVVSSS